MSGPVLAPGVYDAMTASEYHALPSLSSSGAKKLLRSPAHYVIERTQPRAPSEAMRIGTAVHLLVLEPERADELVELPPFNARTKEGRAERDAWLESHRDLLVFDAATLGRIHRAADAVRSHPGAQALLSGGIAERSILWRDATEQIDCRARFDWHRNDGGLVDLKTATDASPRAFSRAIGSYLYHLSAAHYWNGYEAIFDASPLFWAFVVVEVEAPFGVACYVLDSASIRAGMALCARAYRTFRECLERGEWPSYPPTIQPISAPQWALTTQEQNF